MDTRSPAPIGAACEGCPDKNKVRTMIRTYMDNATTSFPKPPAVMEAMQRFANECGTSPGREGYAEAKECQRIISTCRERIARLIHAEGPDRIVFALNCSEALVMVIRGLL
jgi:selenocysteine lyase/cysteine desulfurase